ncbi:transcription factor Adf-1-like [Liolophura sinensis]|uniref:transcription factor Adf-1-like n=1 Tax=Liolophura sinensis TaxID=3198878 RepID=UPI0031594191
MADAEKMDKKEVMILEVAKNTVLFDKSDKAYKETVKKKDIWKAIGEKIGLTGKEVETRWKNVRDGFSKYKRKLKCQSGDAAKPVKEYKYAKALSFLTPYLGDRPTSSNLTEGSDEDPLPPDTFSDEEDDASQISDIQPRHDRPVTPLSTSVASSSQSKRKQRRTQDDLDATLCHYLKKKSRTPEKREEKQDDVDLFLLSMAGTIRKLPARKRTEVKFKIHSVVHQAEMQCCFPEMSTPVDMQPMSELPNLTYTRCMTSPAHDMQPMGSQPTVRSNLESTFQGFQSYSQFLDSQGS